MLQPPTVKKKSVQLFIKRLRKRIEQPIKYFACGEYGDSRQRPHYHICLIGFDFPDKIYWKKSPAGSLIYRSELLEKLWSHPKSKKSYGFAHIGELNFQSAGYTARYTLKKTKDKKQYVHIEDYDPITGEIHKTVGLEPEFIIMSKGIGKDWWNKYKIDTDKDYLSIDYDKKVKVPRYYDKLREKADPESMVEIKQEREANAKEWQADDTPKRRMARNKIKLNNVKMLKRSIEND